MTRLSVLIPAHDEADWIAPCLRALFASVGDLPDREIIVIANACQDQTAQQARTLTDLAKSSGWILKVIETETPGKLPALTLGDQMAKGTQRIYLDADVTVSPGLIDALLPALDGDLPRYATGSPRIARAHSWVSRAYARFWARLPFVAEGTPGFGVFAMNAAGRARWQEWPDIIADDMFARLNFAPAERIRVDESYAWPPVEGFANLIRVRRRQNAGVAELAARYPVSMQNEDKTSLSPVRLLTLMLRDPLGFVVYAAVALGVRSPLYRSKTRWTRGR